VKILRALWAGWKAFAHRLGVINTFIILTVFYFVVIGISALIMFVTRRDLLGIRRREGSVYAPHERQPDTVERLSHLS